MVNVTRFWDTARDLFLPVKEEEMATPALWDALDRAQSLEGTIEERLCALLLMTLWGNRIDLSMHDVASQGTAALDEHLLSDDIAAAVEHLVADRDADVHIVMDNAGTEQALDMALADLLLRSTNRCVILHVKMQPVLVSDVIVADILRLLELMELRGGRSARMSQRLRDDMEKGRLRIAPDFFWTTPDRLWELPHRIHESMDGAALVIMKGDVNYRRATNDAIWPAETTLAHTVRSFPAPLLAIRTLKSDTLVGIDSETYAKLDVSEANWRTAGTYGIIQLASFDHTPTGTQDRDG
jgi:hypothetical protein